MEEVSHRHIIHCLLTQVEETSSLHRSWLVLAAGEAIGAKILLKHTYSKRFGFSLDLFLGLDSKDLNNSLSTQRK